MDLVHPDVSAFVNLTALLMKPVDRVQAACAKIPPRRVDALVGDAGSAAERAEHSEERRFQSIANRSGGDEPHQGRFRGIAVTVPTPGTDADVASASCCGEPA